MSKVISQIRFPKWHRMQIRLASSSHQEAHPGGTGEIMHWIKSCMQLNWVWFWALHMIPANTSLPKNEPCLKTMNMRHLKKKEWDLSTDLRVTPKHSQVCSAVLRAFFLLNLCPGISPDLSHGNKCSAVQGLTEGQLHARQPSKSL